MAPGRERLFKLFSLQAGEKKDEQGGISRRHCLALLGAGAAAALTSAVGETGQATPKAAVEESARQRRHSRMQSPLEELKELGAARVFAPTPVQSRPEGAAPRPVCLRRRLADEPA